MTSPMTLENKLERIIYINNAQSQYFVGNPDEYQKDLSSLRQEVINSSIENGLNDVFSVLDKANADENLPRRSVIFLFLGKLLHYEKMTPELKSKVTAKVLELCQSDEDFFDFIKYYTELRTKSKLPSSVEKVVKKFYTKKTPEELAQSFAKFNSLHKWSHKDLIKLAHVKSDTPLKNIVINNILKRQSNDNATEEQQKVLDIIRKSNELRSTKESVNAIPLLAELKLTMKQVSPSLHQNGEVWAAAIENMTLQEILPCLGKLYRLGLLKPNTSVSNFLTDLFTSSEKVRASKIHPIEVLSFMKRLEKGGKPMDPKLLDHLQNEKKLTEEELAKAKTRTEAKCINILNALQKCFNLACNNVRSTGKRFVVTIDVTDKAKTSLCIGNKVLTFLEAAVAYAIILLRVEKEVVIATYRENSINVIHVDKKISFSELLEKVKSEKSTYSLLFSPCDWAASEKKHIDVFVSFIHDEFIQNIPKAKRVENNLERLGKYRKKLHLPNTKLIIFCLTSRNLIAYHHGSEDAFNILDIFGFDAIACKVADCFCAGTFK